MDELQAIGERREALKTIIDHGHEYTVPAQEFVVITGYLLAQLDTLRAALATAERERDEWKAEAQSSVKELTMAAFKEALDALEPFTFPAATGDVSAEVRRARAVLARHSPAPPVCGCDGSGFVDLPGGAIGACPVEDHP